MNLKDAIALARKRQQIKEFRDQVIARFGEEVEGWFGPEYTVNQDGDSEAIFTHNGVRLSIWTASDEWAVESESNSIDLSRWLDRDEALDELLVAIDDLAPEQSEQSA